VLTLTHPILAGSVALTGTLAVLLLYVLKLRRRPVRVSTVAFFTSAIDDLEANVPWRRLRATWMLLLHLLIIWLLALALGRPVSDAQSARADVIIILDHSASMQALRRPGETSFDAAKRVALERGQQVLASGGRIAILTAAARVQTALPLSKSRTAFIATLAGISPIDQPARLDQAVDAARALVATISAADTGSSPGASDATSETGNPLERPRDAIRIVLITDGVTPLAPDRIHDVEVIVPGGFASDPDNLGIANVAIRRESPVGAQCQLLVRVVNASSQTRVASLRIDIDGKASQRQTIDVPASKSAERGRKSLGSTTRLISLSVPTEAVVTASIIRDDILSIDDAAWVIAPAPQPKSVLLVAPESVVSPVGDDVSFALLKDVLQEIVGSGESDQTPVGSLFVVPPSGLTSMSRESLTSFTVAVFDRVEPPPDFPIGVLAFGTSAGLAAEQPALPESIATRPVWWDRSAPVFADNPIDSILIRNSIPVDQIKQGVRVLARGVQGPLILHDPRTPTKSGRLAVLFGLGESNWPLQVSFPVFTARAVQMLAPETTEGVGRSMSTSDGVTYGLPQASTAPARLRRMDGGSEVSIAPASGQTEITIGPLDRVGVYELSPPLGPPNGLVSRLAVNLANEQVSGLHPSMGATKDDSAAQVVATMSRPTEWWRWCLIGAAGLLGLEWLLFSMLQRRAGR